jgi:AraC-like DNA-binding protein
MVYQEITRYVDAHIKEDITPAEIAQAMGYSASHIYKIFKVYSPYPVMEYIRRKKLYAAASEMYTGRKLWDIALDYGYETPAGFYKAFKSVFGCSPSAYKKSSRNNGGKKIFLKEEGLSMFIGHAKNTTELEKGIRLLNTVHTGQLTASYYDESDNKFGRKWWTEQLDKNPTLLLYAKDNDVTCAVAFGFADGESITVHEGVLAEYKNTGIFESLFTELEKRAKALGYTGIVLGIGEGEEALYAQLGYIGKTLVQSEKYSVEELISFNAQDKNYEITGTSVYEGHINQIWLDASLLDKGLKRRYEQEIGDCWVQVIVSKAL